MAVGFPIALFDNRLNDGVPVASSSAAGFSPLNLRDMRPYTFWKPAAMPATITVDCGTAKTIDSVAIFAHDMSASATVVDVLSSTDNFATSTNEAFVSPTTTAPVLLTFAPTAARRYWRLSFAGAAPTIGLVLLGNRLTFPRRLVQGFDPIGRESVGDTNVSEKGHPLGRDVQFEAWKASLDFRRIDGAWLRSTFLPAWQAYLRGKPWIFSWDPDDHPGESRLVMSGESFKAMSMEGTSTGLSFDVSGVA